MKQFLLIINLLMAILPYSLQAQVFVDEYKPAPGQFVNMLPVYEEGDDAVRMAEKCTETLRDGGMVTLGAWGGSITFHLDHPVVNVVGQRDLYLKGNAYAGCSEPGIVQVSVDANGNGLPDDPWYEIAGSADTDSVAALIPDAYSITDADGSAPLSTNADGVSRMQYGYSLTYYHPSNFADVPWEDADGQTGWVMRNAFHSQDYYPLWMADTLTCVGTLLPPNGSDLSGQGSYWYLEALRYGYADNVANSDTVGCSIDLSWAVDPLTRESVSLTHADFFRIYTAQRQQCGWLGETSTEFAGAIDLHPEAVMGVVAVQAEKQASARVPFLPAGFRHVGRKIIYRNNIK